VETPAKESQLAPTMLLAFGTLVLVITVTRLLRKASNRMRSKPIETPRETIGRVRADASAAREPLSTMMAEANELSTSLAKMLDAKAARLELLIEQADERITSLRNMPDHRAPAGPSRPPVPGASGPRLDDQVLAMVDAGCDVTQVARRLGCSIGEVELIVALRPSRQGA
jgi:hypothetical protein